jgi:UDP-N-acetylmuramoylalanine--D-glutamate ligase
MSNCFFSQELQKNRRRIGGHTAAAVLAKMRAEGVELLGIGEANLPLLTALAPLGIRIRAVRDRRTPAPETLRAIRAVGAEPHFGEGYLEGPLSGVLLRTPSLRPDHPALSAARARGVIVTSEVALVLALTPADIFAVTGSDGKTTTAMMTAAILERTGRRVFLGGNIGAPLFASLGEMRAGDAAVLELSSFQLSDLDPPEGRVAITGITENHLDWHTDMREYIAAKARILGGGCAVLPYDCPLTRPLADGRDAILFTVGHTAPSGKPTVLLRDGSAYLSREGRERRLFPLSALSVRGEHNLKNAMTAAALCAEAAEEEAITAALRGFTPAPHRAEYLGIFRGVRCYDSSIDTTPARTATTLRGFSSPVVILGGRGKNLSPAPLVEALSAADATAVLTGECAGEIAAALPKAIRFVTVPDFKQAVKTALTLAGEGGTLLLSPAATSFDAFPDYRARGRAFAAILKEEENEGV